MCGCQAPTPRASGLQEVKTYQTMTRWLLVMAEWLGELGVTRVVMEATSDYWKGTPYLLEAHGFEVWPANARDVKHLPGRPKTDTLDAVWACASSPSARCCGPALSPHGRSGSCGTWPATGPIWSRSGPRKSSGWRSCWRTPRSSSRWWPATSSGCPGGPCWPRWSPGSATPSGLAQLARARLRAKLSLLEEAFTGFFTDQHAFLLAKMLARVDALDADLAELDAKLAGADRPASPGRLSGWMRSPGSASSPRTCCIAEIGTDMTRFPTAGHLVSWAKFAPGVKESAGKRKGRGSTGHGNPYLARVLGEAAVAASKTDTFLGERYRRIARRRGARGERSSRSAGPSWSSPGTCCPTQRPTSRTSAPASTTPVSVPNAPSATTSASWRPSATRSPSNPPPDRAVTGQPAPRRSDPGSARTLPRACSPLIFGSGCAPRRRPYSEP